MKRAQDLRKRTIGIMERHHHPIISCGKETDRVRRGSCVGFFRNAVRRDASNEEGGPRGYKTLLSGTRVNIYPSSALLGKQAEWVIYHELIFTTREYMRWTTSLEPNGSSRQHQPSSRRPGRGGTMLKRRMQERIQPWHKSSLPTRTTGHCQHRIGVDDVAAMQHRDDAYLRLLLR